MAVKKGRASRVYEGGGKHPGSGTVSAAIDKNAAPGTLEGGPQVENWADDPQAECHIEALALYSKIVKLFDNKEEQASRIVEYWDIYNAQPDENLQYAGNSLCYVPAVRDALNARAKRCLKQLFPANHRHVDGLSSDGSIPYTQLSLLEHYIRKTQLKSVVRSVLISGDVTGQWNLGVDWSKSYRHVKELTKRNPLIETIDGENIADLGLEDPLADEVEELDERDVVEEAIELFDIATEDIAVLPPTCNDLQKARAVAVRLRLSKEQIEAMVDEGVFILPEGSDLDDFMRSDGSKEKTKAPDKRQTQDAGIRTEGSVKYGMFYQVDVKLDFGAKHKEAAIVYYSGPDTIIGLIKNPLWSGKRAVISQPVDRINGSFFGKSKIEPVKFMQWNLCDFWNMGQDSAMYSLLPIFKADPLNNPNWAQMVMGLAAVWPIAPGDMDVVKMPQLWKDSQQMCSGIKAQIWESLEVNESMMGRMPQGRKNNQLMQKMQQEQEINITDHAERFEEVMLNPLVEFLFEFDQQFRTAAVTIQSRGEIGAEASIKEIPVQQWGEKYFFSWCGTAFMRNTQLIQQQIASMNVMKGIPAALLNGRRFDFTPFIERLAENAWGPELASKILIDERNMFTIDAEVENEILHNGMEVQVHEADNDPEHLQKHMRAAGPSGDPGGLFKTHMARHMLSMQAKREKQMAQAQAMQKGAPGAPGGAGPGVPGGPRPGAMPGDPRAAQNPPGAVQQDDMPGAPGRG